MSNPLDKVINLIKKTGDNCIILDSSGRPSYVVMDFARYETMALAKSRTAELPEDQLRAVSAPEVFEDAMEEANIAPKVVEIDQDNDPFFEKNSLNEAKNKEESGQTEEKYYFEPID